MIYRDSVNHIPLTADNNTRVLRIISRVCYRRAPTTGGPPKAFHPETRGWLRPIAIDIIDFTSVPMRRNSFLFPGAFSHSFSFVMPSLSFENGLIEGIED